MSSKKAIPTESSVRAFYVGGRDEYDPNPVSEEQMYADFDRFITQVRVEAWEECATAHDNAPELWPGMIAAPINPYEADE